MPETVDHAPEPTEASGPTVVVDAGLDHGLLDRDAVRAVARLQERGFEAYLVGGCVRDLMLGQRPKDFDLATSARPSQIKRVFPRNCRIIGRRFKLAHLHFDDNQKILEVATFRRDPSDRESDSEEDEDLLITRDNEFGTAAEDARRRDFTINALFLDPIADEILDHTGGLVDLDRRMIRTIGDPETRFREDPVRILRAIKFASRLELDFEPATEAGMRTTVEDLTRAAPPRLLEELLRLLRGGHALDAFLHLRDLGALEVLLPDVHDFLQSTDDAGRLRFWRTIEALDGSSRRAQVDQSYARHWPPLAGVLLGALFAEPVRDGVDDDEEDASDVAERICGRFAIDYKLPKKDSAALKRTTAVQPVLHEAAADGEIEPRRFGRHGWFRESLDLFAWTNAANQGPANAVEKWRRLGRDIPRSEEEEELGSGRKRRRRTRSRSRSGRDDEREDDRRESRRTSDDDRKPEPGRKKKSTKKKAAKGPKEKSSKDTEKKGAKKKRKSRDERAASKVRTLEPEYVDTSAFDVELDPTKAATFGSLVEGPNKRKKPRTFGTDDDYRPPSLDDDGGSSPPPPKPHTDDDTFGDW